VQAAIFGNVGTLIVFRVDGVMSRGFSAQTLPPRLRKLSLSELSGLMGAFGDIERAHGRESLYVREAGGSVRCWLTTRDSVLR
jgi:hypothetical protein